MVFLTGSDEPATKIDEGDLMNQTEEGRRWRSRAGAAGLVAGGLLAGGMLASTLSATAADSSSTATPSASAAAPSAPGGARDESKSQRPDEKLLTGTTADKVRAAALKKYPGATILRVETDSDGVYEAHLTTAAGQRATVEVGKDFAVTGEEAGGFGGHGGPPPGAPGTSGSGGSAQSSGSGV
jgi:hypothetical protein